MTMFGSAFDDLFGASARSYAAPPTCKVHIQTGAEMKPGETLYYFGHTWRRSPGEICTVSGGGYRTVQEADEGLLRALTAAGFMPARWWHWWRWGERAIKPDVLKALNGNL